MNDESSAIPMARADAWLKSRRRRVLATVLGLAILVRVLAFAELVESPIVEAHQYAEMDMRFFDEWAKTIVQRDALGRQAFHPMHTWHEAVASAYYDDHPEILGRPIAEISEADRDAAVRKIWDKWYQGNRFHQEPLYAYTLAAIYAIQGTPDVRTAFVIQMLGGVLLVLLIYLSTRRLFGDVAAVFTAVMAGCWGPLVHYEMTLLRTSFVSLAGIALLYAAQRAIDSRDVTGAKHRWTLFGFGCLIGIATALKSTFLLFSGGLLIVLFWPLRKDLPRVSRQVGAIGVGIILVLAPIWVRNSLVGAPLFSMTSVGAVTFAGSNVPGYEATSGWSPKPIAGSVAEVMETSGGGLFGAVSVTLGMYESLIDYVSVLNGKLLMIFHWFEMPNNTSYYFSCVHSEMLNILRYLVSALWIIPAALIGIVASLRRWRSVGTWWWYLVCSLAPMLVFYMLSRFRAPMIVGMMPFAAFGIVKIFDWATTRRLQRALLALMAFGVMVLTMNRGFSMTDQPVAAGCYSLSVHAYYLPRIEKLRLQGKHPEALRIVEHLLDSRPAYIDEIASGTRVSSINEFQMISSVFVAAYRTAAGAAAQCNQMQLAERYLGRSAQLKRAAAAFRSAHGGGEAR